MKRERIEDIAEILDKRGKMTLEQLEEVFPNVSQMTLRRDLFQGGPEGFRRSVHQENRVEYRRKNRNRAEGCRFD